MDEQSQHYPKKAKENSLTAPEDRVLDKNGKMIWRPEQGARTLTESEVKEAINDLNETSFIDKFPRVDRTFTDPPIPMQNIGLFSFTPAQGAIPNKKGIYGWAKIRGNYATSIEANQRAEFLVRNADSYHKIFHTYVGYPFPVTCSSKFSAETNEIDISNQMIEDVSKNIKKCKDEEQKTVREIKERENMILSESKKARSDDGIGDPDVDPYDQYITLNVKKAQLTWTFLEHLNKLKEIREIIIKTRNELKIIDKNYPDFKNKYFDKYIQARKNAGLDEKIRETQDNFIKYMIEDVSVPTIDTNEILPIVSNSIIK